MTQAAPIHVNQTTAGGRFPCGLSSTRYDCTVCVAIMLADAATGGRIRPTVTQIRALESDNDTNGIGWNDAAAALAKLGVTLKYGPTGWGTLLGRWRAGDGAGLQGNYAAVPVPYTSQPGGRFGHAIYVQRETRPGWLLVNDPLAKGPREWPAAIVQRFYLTGLARAAWVGSSSGAAVDSSGTVLSLVNAKRAAACTEVRILAPGLTGIGLFPIPRDAIGGQCVECAPGYVPAIVSVGPVQTLQGFTSPETIPGLANACVKAGTLPGQRPDSSGVPGAALDALGAWVAPLVAGIGDVVRNGALLGFGLVTLLIGLYILATAGDRGRVPVV